jgi:hypothetical protein
MSKAKLFASQPVRATVGEGAGALACASTQEPTFELAFQQFTWFL